MQNSRPLIAIASLGFVLTGIVNTFLGPILPFLAARWSLSDSRSGYFFAMQFFGSILGVGISSFLLPRRGFRFCLGLAYLLMAAGVAGLALSQWQHALLGTFTLGLGFGLGIPVTNLLISGANQSHRSSALSILNFCWGLGAIVAPITLAVSARRDRTSTFVVLLSGLLLLVAVSLAFTSAREPERQKKENSSQSQTSAPWRLTAIVGGMFFLYVAIEASVGGWIATLVQRVPMAAARYGALAPSLFWAGLLAGRGLAPLVLSRVRERRVALSGLLVAAAGLGVIAASPHWQAITASGFAVGIGLAAVFPITIALLSQFRAAEKRMAGPMFALAGLGGATMPWLVGAVSTWSGSLQAGLMVPLLATTLLLWLHYLGNYGSLTEPHASCSDSKTSFITASQ
jgi:fucose permease